MKKTKATHEIWLTFCKILFGQKKKKKQYEKRKCWKPVSSFLAMLFKAFFYMVIKTLDYSQLIKNDL